MQQILETAAQMVVSQGAFPLPLDVLAERLRISKALIYTYFSTQHDLGNALLLQRLDALTQQDLETAMALADWRAAATACVDIYFDETATNGPLLHVLLSDPYLARRCAPALLARYRRIMGRLARRIRALAGLPSAEAVSALTIIVAIAEEAGTLVNSGRLDVEFARDIARSMTIGAIENLCGAKSPATEDRPAPAARSARHPSS